ncbi:hypothetical protein COX97_01385 [Candidatus Pacearchaeota archaeon CG_4_10_14_0_2_um_filter_05_32_18]|nr:MAG: hypothetical protein COX97_01385 [Candidatus Pacearchaeota archaeon CG_4_10_14_0_2_um_filter_05_32_18]
MKFLSSWMDKKLKVVIFTLIVVILAAIIVFSVGNTTSNTIKSTDSGKQGLSLLGNTIQNNMPLGIPLEELSKHDSETDCWVVYQGKVYDLTSWLTKHPGGVKTILPHCGTQNFEVAFKAKHGNSKASLFLQVSKLMGDFQLKGNLN